MHISNTIVGETTALKILAFAYLNYNYRIQFTIHHNALSVKQCIIKNERHPISPKSPDPYFLKPTNGKK